MPLWNIEGNSRPLLKSGIQDLGIDNIGVKTGVSIIPVFVSPARAATRGYCSGSNLPPYPLIPVLRQSRIVPPPFEHLQFFQLECLLWCHRSSNILRA